ncbi:Hsp20/alpha crystallin family protein [Natronorarus salvus]|uniref:Hsp20/alpha crystallin family protein n=1 Tax=Natronorarus salvus TaxID=3117733 RepID=UPI002F264C0B
MRRDPFDEMDRMFEQMRRMMASGYPRAMGWGGDDARSDLPALGGFAEQGLNASIESDDEGYLVYADVPGFEKEELSLRFDGGILTIEAAHEEGEESETGVHHRSRHVHETLSVPGDVLEEEISATYRNGVLEVRLPTADEADESGRTIDIE